MSTDTVVATEPTGCPSGVEPTGCPSGADVGEVMDAAIAAAIVELVPVLGTRAACAAVGRSRATHYRHHRVGPPPAPKPRAESRREVRDLLNSERFVYMAPASVYATLLDEGRYLCSESSMYRILRDHGRSVGGAARPPTRRG